jgi:hypothetical protein
MALAPASSPVPVGMGATQQVLFRLLLSNNTLTGLLALKEINTAEWYYYHILLSFTPSVIRRSQTVKLF